MTTGQAIEDLRMRPRLLNRDIERILQISSASWPKIKKGQRELSFLMAVRLLEYFETSLSEFCGLLSTEELNRPELATIKYW